MKIYTKTGDKGTTSLIGGERVPKCCDRLESYGTIDELNSHIGVLETYCKDKQDKDFLTTVQNTLFVVGGYLATDNSNHAVMESTTVTEEMVRSVETEIDRLQEIVPPLKYFVLPGGSRPAAYAHVCRTVCRRAERCILRLCSNNIVVDEKVIAYINRLSDYFFALSRKLNVDEGVEDVAWKP